MTQKYRSKPEEIEAVQALDTNVAELEAFTGGTVNTVPDDEGFLQVNTTDGPLRFLPGHFIASPGNGAFYAVQPATFLEVYEAV